MNKVYIAIIGISIFLLGGYFYIVLGTDVFRFYYNSTSANEPNLPTGAKVIVSSLMKPKRLDFACYTYSDQKFGEFKKISRLVGIPGDTIKIRKGVLYVNGKNTDSLLSLMHLYTVPKKLEKELSEIKAVQRVMHATYNYYNDSQDSIQMYLTQEVANKHKDGIHRKILEKGKPDNFMFSMYKAGWNKDYFGPLFLDQNEYFVIGDNRDLSEDSRFTGVVKKSQLIGKVIRF